MHCEPPQITFIPCEEHFRPVLPTIEGNVDYLSLRGQLTTMDELLRASGVENEFVVRSLDHWIKTLSESQVELGGEAQQAARSDLIKTIATFGLAGAFKAREPSGTDMPNRAQKVRPIIRKATQIQIFDA
jgi:hypothetical protein